MSTWTLGTATTADRVVRAFVEGIHAFSSDYRFVPVSAQADAPRYALEEICLAAPTIGILEGQGGTNVAGR